MNSGHTWHVINARKRQGPMEIAINAMTPHALVQTPSQGRPLQYLDPPYQLYAAVIVLTRYHHWYDLGTKLLSLPLIPKQIQMVRRR